MEKYLGVIKQSAVFKNLEGESLEAALRFVGAHIKSYKKKETVRDYNDEVAEMGIILEGSCQIIRIDIEGNRTILRNLDPGQSFGDTIILSGLKQCPVIIAAATDCAILYISIKKVMESLSAHHDFVSIMTGNIIQILAAKSIALLIKNEILAKSTIREKLLTYFKYSFENPSTKAFVLPFNQEELADYLSINRSALARELTQMRRDGIITYEKNIFKLNRRPAENEFK